MLMTVLFQVTISSYALCALKFIAAISLTDTVWVDQYFEYKVLQR